MNSFVTKRGEVVAVWVFVQKWPGVAQCFAWTSTLVDVMPKEFWKACKRGLTSAHEAIGVPQDGGRCASGPSSTELDGYKLGFKIEGCMRQYGVDKMGSYLLRKGLVMAPAAIPAWAIYTALAVSTASAWSSMVATQRSSHPNTTKGCRERSQIPTTKGASRSAAPP